MWWQLLSLLQLASAQAGWSPAPIANSTMQGALEIMSEGVASIPPDNPLGWEPGFLFSNKVVMHRTNTNLSKILQSSPTADFVPPYLVKQGYHHCGDTDLWVEKGLVLVPCSCYPVKHPPPFIAYMDAKTMTFTQQIVFLPAQGDAPWVAMDAATSLVYTSDYWMITKFAVLDSSLKPLRNVTLSTALNQIQGGAVYQSQLFLSSNIKDTVYTVDPSSGKVEVALEQLGSREMEGMAFLDLTALGMGLLHFFENGRVPKVLFHYDWHARLPLPVPAAVGVCNVMDYGAKGDGKTLDTLAVERAISACSRGTPARPQTVLFPAGYKFLLAPFNLTSNLVVEIQPGAMLLASPRVELWAVLPPLPSYGTGRELPGPRYTSFVHAQNVSHVAVRGGGVIDGQGAAWWARHRNGSLLHTRGRLIEFMWSNDITITNVTLQNSPFWTVHPVYCRDVLIEDVTIRNPSDSPNTDGVDPDSCSNVLINRCDISCGDDVIAIKSGYNEYGVAYGMPSKNITVANTVFGTGHGIAIGSEMSGGVSNIRFINLTLRGTQRGPRIKTAPERSGYVTNVLYHNITLASVQTGISVSMDYGVAGASPSALPLPVLKGFVYEHISGQVEVAGDMECAENNPCDGIAMRDVNLKTTQQGFTCKFVYGTAVDVTPQPCLQR